MESAAPTPTPAVLIRRNSTPNSSFSPNNTLQMEIQPIFTKQMYQLVIRCFCYLKYLSQKYSYRHKGPPTQPKFERITIISLMPHLEAGCLVRRYRKQLIAEPIHFADFCCPAPPPFLQRITYQRVNNTETGELEKLHKDQQK